MGVFPFVALIIRVRIVYSGGVGSLLTLKARIKEDVRIVEIRRGV